MLNHGISRSINIFVILNFVLSQQNVKELFEIYKYKYHRVYGNEHIEKLAFSNFVNNLNNMKDAEFKANSTGVGTIYKLNIYADQDPEEVNEHYGIRLGPYDNIINGTKKNTAKALEDMHLFDLDKVEDLYTDWQKKWGKVRANHTYERKVRLYRFIKTVADINKKKFKGEFAHLGPNADVVLHPQEYFYG